MCSTFLKQSLKALLSKWGCKLVKFFKATIFRNFIFIFFQIQDIFF
jgi:hypothetical protein